MTKTITIDPVTRVEGHLAIETRIESGRIVEARVAGQMFRGFEALLVNRHPVDAARITQRVCGICHEVHGIAASMALEDLYGLVPSRNGLILRELILGLHLVTDHLFHFYQLTLPDYLDFGVLKNDRRADRAAGRLAQIFRDSGGTFAGVGMADALREGPAAFEMARGYADALAVRKRAGSGLASLGGKVPFCHAILPGGVTTGVNSDRLMNYSLALEETADFVRQRYLPHALALAEHFPGYFAIGRSHGNFYGNGGFVLGKAPLYRAGTKRATGAPEPVRFEKIAESDDASFLSVDGRMQPSKAGAYSWVKALHYDGRPMEVGPLARLAVNPDQGFARILRRFQQGALQSSVMARILARAYEAQKICDYLQALLPAYRLNEPTINPPDMQAKPSGEGIGMSLAARGALNHQVIVEQGRVVRYRLLVPSAWNFGPTVQGRRGTVETALLGTEVAGTATQGSQAIEIGRIVRSFDPCLACAIH